MGSWLAVKSSDPRARALRDRHYSTRRPGGRTVGPPGRRLVLVTEDGLALWVTHWPRPDLVLDGIDALRCTVFRNEGPTLSSTLIREAMELSEAVLGRAPAGWLTYVWPSRVQSAVPGWCFRRAGFRRDRSWANEGRLIRLRHG